MGDDPIAGQKRWTSLWLAKRMLPLKVVFRSESGINMFAVGAPLICILVPALV
jgi:hypothetical protein